MGQNTVLIAPEVMAAFAARTQFEICVACPPKITGGYAMPEYSTLWSPSGRDILPDAPQEVFGYFGGGGWTFGLVETANSRVSVDTYRAYMKAKEGQTITISQKTRYWEDSPYLGGDGHWVERDAKTITIGVDIPQFSKLIPTDILAFKHDMMLAESRESGFALYDGQIHAMLYNAANTPIDKSTFDGRYTGSIIGDERLYDISESYRKKYLKHWLLDWFPGGAPNGL
jgi:hypothetical protein